MKELLRKLYDAFRQYRFGIANLMLNRLFPTYFRYQKFLLYRYSLLGEIKDNPIKRASLAIKKVVDTGDNLFHRFRKKFPAEEFVRRLEQENKVVYIATINGDVAGYAWVAKREIFVDQINKRFKLQSDKIFIYSCYVTREYRGMEIYPTMLSKILQEYASEAGFKEAYIGVKSVNRGSIKGINKAGFKLLGSITYLKYLNREKWWGMDKLPDALSEKKAVL